MISRYSTKCLESNISKVNGERHEREHRRRRRWKKNFVKINDWDLMASNYKNSKKERKKSAFCVGWPDRSGSSQGKDAEYIYCIMMPVRILDYECIMFLCCNYTVESSGNVACMQRRIHSRGKWIRTKEEKKGKINWRLHIDDNEFQNDLLDRHTANRLWPSNVDKG